MGVGTSIPAAFCTCVVVPVGLFWLLKAQAASANEQSFREHFGFLYRNYKHEKMWLEAVWAVQTVLLSLVAAFHFRLEAYFSMLLLCCIFALSAAVQNMFEPYTLQKLHQVHFASTGCLFVTCLGALAMFPVDKAASSVAAAHAVIAVLVILVDAGFVLHCLHAAVMVSHGRLKAMCARAAALFTCNTQRLPCRSGSSTCGSSASMGQLGEQKPGPVHERVGAVAVRPADSAASLQAPFRVGRELQHNDCAHEVA